MLAAGQQALDGRSRDVVTLAEHLLARDDSTELTFDKAQHIILAGELLIEVGRERVMRGGPRHAAVWQKATDDLLQLLPYPPSTPLPPLSASERARAGLVLAQLGDRRPGVCTIEPAWSQLFPASEYMIGTKRDTVQNKKFDPTRLIGRQI